MAPADTMLAAAYCRTKQCRQHLDNSYTALKKNGVQKTRIPTVHVLNGFACQKKDDKLFSKSVHRAVCHCLSCMLHQFITETPLKHHCRLCRHHVCSPKSQIYTLITLFWYKMFFSFSFLSLGKPKSSIKKTTRDVPAFVLVA